MKEYFTVDSFGAECPINWEEIAEALNRIADREVAEVDNEVYAKEIVEGIWEAYCMGNLPGVPEEDLGMD